MNLHIVLRIAYFHKNSTRITGTISILPVFYHISFQDSPVFHLPV